MRTKHHLIYALVLGVLLSATLLPAATALTPADLTQRPAPASADNPATIVLHEIMPKAATGAAEWVEIHNTEPFLGKLYLPLIAHTDTNAAGAAVPATTDAAPNLVEGTAVVIAGWQVTNKAGVSYTIPDALPPVPGGGFVLIYFDGQGPAADQLHFVNGVAKLHTPPGIVNVFADAADQVALYTGSEHTPATLRDFVAWGAPPQQATDALANGLWRAGEYLDFAPSGGYVAPGDVALSLQPNEAVGRFPGYGDTWSIYRSNQLTPGAANPIPDPPFSRPANGEIVDAANVVLGWSVLPHATRYHVQIATDATFATLVVNTTTPYADYHHSGLLGPALFYWRICTETGNGDLGPWSPALTIQTLDLTATVSAAGANAEKTLGIVWQVQHKDTYLLELSQYNHFRHMQRNKYPA